MNPLEIHSTDILVLGAGLAGLRAALSAHNENSDLRITIVSAQPGPTGSSFANRNNCLGMQVCFSSSDQGEFIREVTALAAPGTVQPELVRALAIESVARFEDMLRLGFRFRRDGENSWQLLPACFSPNSRRAVVFDDLPHAFSCFQNRLSHPNITWLPGWAVLNLIQKAPGAPVRGAILGSSQSATRLAIRAAVTILALGGPAPIFRHNLAGSANWGYSYGLMHKAGIRLANTAFLQLMWSELPSGKFYPLTALANPTKGIGPRRTALPADLAALIALRATHCPIGYAYPDSAVDTFLAKCLLEYDKDTGLEISAHGHTLRIAPHAHAGNGGARIDAQARTSVPQALACGECATGMHGANRIGGGMVLATQVFGHRAGIEAARTATQGSVDAHFIQLVNKQNATLTDNLTANQATQYTLQPVVCALSGCHVRQNAVAKPSVDAATTQSLRARLTHRTYVRICRHIRSLSNFPQDAL